MERVTHVRDLAETAHREWPNSRVETCSWLRLARGGTARVGAPLLLITAELDALGVSARRGLGLRVAREALPPLLPRADDDSDGSLPDLVTPESSSEEGEEGIVLEENDVV